MAKHRRAGKSNGSGPAASASSDLATVGALVLMLTIAGEPNMTAALSGITPSLAFRIGEIPNAEGIKTVVPAKPVDRVERPIPPRKSTKGNR